ncbi:hypothetical protein ACOSP7_021367 [Xanthoceras sorbifolium]
MKNAAAGREGESSGQSPGSLQAVPRVISTLLAPPKHIPSITNHHNISKSQVFIKEDEDRKRRSSSRTKAELRVLRASMGGDNVGYCAARGVDLFECIVAQRCKIKDFFTVYRWLLYIEQAPSARLNFAYAGWLVLSLHMFSSGSASIILTTSMSLY